MAKIKYEKLATLAANGTRTECSSFAIRRRLKNLVSSEEYNSVLQKEKEAVIGRASHKLNRMNWTEPKDPTQGVSHYTHVISETPLGQCLIEWKGWKESDSYSVTIGNEYIGEGYDLEDGKRLSKEWLTKKHKELSELLGL